MASEGITATGQARVFQCPNCQEDINTSMSQCRFCGLTIDYDKAQAAAEIQAKTNQACSDASYLKICSGPQL